MQIQPQKFTQLFMTGVGLLLFAVAMTLNHYHPRNQGIANLTRGAIFKEFGISDAAASDGSGLSYVNLLPKVAQTTNSPKIADPTATPADQQDQPAALPTVAQADGSPDNSADGGNTTGTSPNVNQDKDKDPASAKGN